MDEKVINLILEKNKALLEGAAPESWVTYYDKVSDMMFLEDAPSPEGTFYVPLGETRFMFKVDKDYVLYGFAIENAKFFVKENPQFSYAFFPFMSPVKYKILAGVITMALGISRITQAVPVARDFAIARAKLA